MRDGSTRKLRGRAESVSLGEFLDRFEAKLVVVDGGDLGAEHLLDRELVTLGRGPAVDVAFDDPAMSRQHVAIELVNGEFRIRDLGSTNGVLVNDLPIRAGALSHGDRIGVGSLVLQLVIEEKETAPDTYELPSEV